MLPGAPSAGTYGASLASRPRQSQCTDGIASGDGERFTQSESGFTLIIVLVALVSLAGLLSGLLLLSRETSEAARIIERQAVARVAEFAAYGRLDAALRDPADRFEEALSADNGQITIRFSGHSVSLSLEREGGKIDPRITAPAILARFLARAAPPPPPQLSETLRMSSNPSDLRVALLSSLLPWLDVDQIAQDFTLWGQNPGIDPTGASLPVLMALPDLTPADARQVFESHGATASAGFVHSDYFGPPSRRFSLRLAIRWTDSESWVRRIPFEVTGSGRPMRLDGSL